MSRRRSTPEPRATSRSRGRSSRLSNDQLRRLVDEATIDAYGESEQVTGFFTMLEDHLDLPFETKVLGVPVTVEGIDLDESDRIVALCRRGKKRQAIGLLDLPLPSPPPDGWEWIDAYRYWAT